MSGHTDEPGFFHFLPAILVLCLILFGQLLFG